MSNSVRLISLLFAVVVSCGLIEAVCREHNRPCCRQNIEYGRCNHHVRRYAYNVSCGKCVPFDYSGCGGYENIFESIEECGKCCRGTNPCPRYTLPPPPQHCSYNYYNGPDECARPRLRCNCKPQYCVPNACRLGQRCVPYSGERPCNSCPCKQYECVSDPCYGVKSQLLPCETCVPLPAPSCHKPPCALMAYRENRCPPPYPHHRPQRCPLYVECPPQGNPCQYQQCANYPQATCQVDPCDCRKYYFTYGQQQYLPQQCYPANPHNQIGYQYPIY